MVRSTRLLAAAAASVVGVMSAQAADLPSRTVAPVAPAFVAYNWTGLYVGANLGYAWGTGRLSVPGVAGSLSGDYDGFLGGLQVGANYQINQFVLGVEADVMYAGIDRTESITGVAFAKSEMNWLGTVRGRLGVAFDRLLPYVTGGFAWGNNEMSGAVVGVGRASESKTHFGWTLGAGLEYAVMNNVTIKAEYLYVDLGKENYAASLVPGGFDAKARLNIVRLGANYKF